MAGRPKSKVFCQSLRRDGKPCLAKGFLCKNNKYFCRFHGFQNILGFQKPNYTHDTRKKQLRKLKQFKDLTEEAFNTYYEEKLRPRIERQEKSTYHTRFLNSRKYTNSLYRIQNHKPNGDQNPEIEQDVLDARKIGIQTSIDRLLEIFNHQELENPNQILWITRKADFVKWIAGKITDLYSDNKVQKVDQKTEMKISWGNDEDDLIDVNAEDVSAPTPDKS